jgi:hypothetical protein
MNLMRYSATGPLAVYLGFTVFAFVAAIADLGGGPLSATFLLVAAFPWTVPIVWVLDRLGEPPLWLSYALMLAGILVNALLLYSLVRLTRRSPR